MGAASPSRHPAALPARRLASPPGNVLGRARYRAWQFFRGLRAHISPDEATEVRTLLSDRELALFLRMEAADRRHSLDLLHELRRDAANLGRDVPHELLAAALVHDAGKGPLRMWHRVLFVLLNAIDERLARRIEAEHGSGWRQALWRLRHHARLSAALLREAGTDQRVIEIVEAHTGGSPADDRDLAWFIQADDRV